MSDEQQYATEYLKALGFEIIPRAKLEAYEAAMEALEFYADWETYFAIGFFPDAPCGDFMDDFSEVEDDLSAFATRPGKRARKALAALSAHETKEG